MSRFPNHPGFYTANINGSLWTIPDRYEKLIPMATSSHGLVCGAYDTQTGLKVVIKKLHNVFKEDSIAKQVFQELKLIKAMDHENIVNLMDIFSVDPDLQSSKANRFLTQCLDHDAVSDIYIVGPLMDADLSHIIKIQKLSEEHVKFIMYQLLRGLKYLHSSGIIHGDLEPRNIGLNEDCELKILSFGNTCTSEAIQKKKHTKKKFYEAPETVLHYFPTTQAADMWSAGCIMGEMITGKRLFPRADHINRLSEFLQILAKSSASFDEDVITTEIREYVRAMKPKDFKKQFDSVPRDAVNLLDGLLQVDPAIRLNAEQALAHPYFADYHDPEDEPVMKTAVDLEDEKKLSISEWKVKVLKEMYEFLMNQNAMLFRKLTFEKGTEVEV